MFTKKKKTVTTAKQDGQVSGVHFNNLAPYLKFRHDSLAFRLAREEYVSQIISALCSANGITPYLWTSRAGGTDRDEVTGVQIRWTEFYPYTEGLDDDYYVHDKERAWNHMAQIWVSAQGSEPGDFIGAVHFDCKQEYSFNCSQVIQVPQKWFLKNQTNLAAPAWFMPFLIDIANTNAKFMQK